MPAMLLRDGRETGPVDSKYSGLARSRSRKESIFYTGPYEVFPVGAADGGGKLRDA
jgi:hypothetical protein